MQPGFSGRLPGGVQVAYLGLPGRAGADDDENDDPDQESPTQGETRLGRRFGPLCGPPPGDNGAQPGAASFANNCLLARRLVERGVRFVELYCGSGSGWDAHENVETNHSKWCRASDKPIAGLLTDLKELGLLQDTLVVWGGAQPTLQAVAAHEPDYSGSLSAGQWRIGAAPSARSRETFPIF